MSTFYTAISILIPLGYYLLITGVAIRILYIRRSVPSVTAWLLVIFFLPFVGVIAYLLIGELNIGKERIERAKTIWPRLNQWLNELKQKDYLFSESSSDVARPIFQLCEHRQVLPPIKNNHLSIFTSFEQTYASIIQDINDAKSNIEMMFYILHPQGLAEDVCQALIIASRRGVRCRLILDSAGSRSFFSSKMHTQMQDAGIEIVEALKVSIIRAVFRRMDLRQHRKLIIIDNAISYTGSMNMVDPRYFKQESGVGQWIDMMVRMEGYASSMLGIIYACDWELETGEVLAPTIPEKSCFDFDFAREHNIHAIASGPGYPEELIHQALLTAVYAAREQLIMTTPYFVPSDDLLHAICTAAQRGVDVKIILPAKNDSLMVGWASRTFYTELLEAGVKIYKFHGGLLHTKSVLVDRQVSLVGSVNLDMRSLWLNFELTLVVDDVEFGERLANLQQTYIMSADKLTYDEWQQRPIWNRVVERLFYFFSPLL